jgi:hypothetical protein
MNLMTCAGAPPPIQRLRMRTPECSTASDKSSKPMAMYRPSPADTRVSKARPAMLAIAMSNDGENPGWRNSPRIAQ